MINCLRLSCIERETEQDEGDGWRKKEEDKHILGHTEQGQDTTLLAV